MDNSNSLRSFPFVASAHRGVKVAAKNTIRDCTPFARLGVRGQGVPNWLTANGLPFPQKINHTTFLGSMRIVRLGQTEVLILPPLGAPPPEFDKLVRASVIAPQGVYDAFRHETWSWLRIAGEDAYDAMARITAVDLRPGHIAGGDVLQTRVANLDAVLVVADASVTPAFEIFSDIASYYFLAETLRELCPDFVQIGENN